MSSHARKTKKKTVGEFFHKLVASRGGKPVIPFTMELWDIDPARWQTWREQSKPLPWTPSFVKKNLPLLEHLPSPHMIRDSQAKNMWPVDPVWSRPETLMLPEHLRKQLLVPPKISDSVIMEGNTGDNGTSKKRPAEHRESESTFHDKRQRTGLTTNQQILRRQSSSTRGRGGYRGAAGGKAGYHGSQDRAAATPRSNRMSQSPHMRDQGLLKRQEGQFGGFGTSWSEKHDRASGSMAHSPGSSSRSPHSGSVAYSKSRSEDSGSDLLRSSSMDSSPYSPASYGRIERPFHPRRDMEDHVEYSTLRRPTVSRTERDVVLDYSESMKVEQSGRESQERR